MDIESPMPSQDRAVEALHAQGITAPGPVLLGLVRDTIAREAEGLRGGERRHQLDYAELLADTPELMDRTEGPLENPGDRCVLRSRGGPHEGDPLPPRGLKA
jgi:hypothetical protein